MNDSAKIFQFRLQYLYDEDENNFEEWESVQEYTECGFIIALSMKDAYEQIDNVYGLDLPFMQVESLKINLVDKGTMITFDVKNSILEDAVKTAEVYDGRCLNSNEYYAFVKKPIIKERVENEVKGEG